MRNPRAQRRIGAIEVGFRLVRALEAADGLVALKELSQLAGMPASKAHAYVASFVHEGLMIQDPVTGYYGLGPFAMQLGAAALRQSDLIDVVRDEATVLTETTTSSVILNTWGNRGPTIVYRIEGKRRGPTSIRVGYVLPLWETATGRVFLAHLPESETRALLQAEIRGRVAASTVRAALEQIRRAGYAAPPRESSFAGFAAPIFDHDGRIVATLTLSRPSEAPARGARSAPGPAVRDVARKISIRLGYVVARQRSRQVRSRAAKNGSPAFNPVQQ